MFERFTDRARRVVVLAQEEARMLNHNYIGTEHILLGLVHEGEGVAVQALDSLNVSLEAARRRVEEIIGQGQTPAAGHIPFTPRAKRVLELALREATQLGHNYIGTEHILLGVLREGEGVACQVLVSMGVDLSKVRQAVVQLLSGWQGRRMVGSTEPFTLGDPVPVTARLETRSSVGHADPSAMPLCPSCRKSLEGNLMYRVLEARDGAQGGDEVRHVVFLFCTRCGTTIDDWMLPKDKP